MKNHMPFLLAGFLLPQCVNAAIFDWQDKPEANHEMAFRLYVPDSVKKVRSVIMLTPGFNGDGRGRAGNPAWQALAERTDSALLACSMRGDYDGIYYEAEKWSGKVVFKALKNLAKESGHPEIADAPIALWGHSAGGQFNFNFANWEPKRVVAFVVNKGAYYGEQIRSNTRKIPALWILGENDTPIRINNITTKYQDGRKSGALWALIEEPNTGHEVGRSQDIGIVFLEEVLNARVDVMGNLKPADPSHGWLGDPETKTIEKNNQPGSGSKKHGWFPGEKTAKLWLEIVGGVPAGDNNPSEEP